MDRFIWKDEYGVNIADIDEQHRYFFEIANRFVDLTEKENLMRSDVFEVLEKLDNYAIRHFGLEERYFDEIDYEGAPEHIAAHNEFRCLVGEYLSDLENEKDIRKLAEKAAVSSVNWLLNHILVMDKKYTVYFNYK